MSVLVVAATPLEAARLETGRATVVLTGMGAVNTAHGITRQLGTQPKTDGASPGDAGRIFTKRTGPIVAVASGPLSVSEATSLLASVNYDADVTWNENTSFSKKDNLANLLVNIILLCGILMGLALVAGIAFGGIRILVKRIMPERVFDRPEGMEFISLNLSDERVHRLDSEVSPSIKAG